MLRETTFWLGGIVTMVLGVLLAVGLYWSAAGFEFADAWLASGISVGFGAFFVYVAREEHRDRLAVLASHEVGGSEPPGTGNG